MYDTVRCLERFLKRFRNWAVWNVVFQCGMRMMQRGWDAVFIIVYGDSYIRLECWTLCIGILLRYISSRYLSKKFLILQWYC